MKTYIYTLLICMTSSITYAATYQVGPTRTYTSPNELYSADILQDGDIVEIDAADYRGSAALAVWKANNLIIKGIGGKPHLIAEGEYIWGKGIWVLAGDNIIVENIEFSGATVPDKNGAGIRLDGIGMTVRNCYFHDNEDGILTTNTFAGNILIEYSEFDNNGYGDGQSHNLYIGHCDQLIFRYNYSHHAIIGHNLKSRAQENIILYNRIMDEESGESSRLIDLSIGGFTIIMGNILMQGNNAPNKNLVGYGLEGLTNQNNEFYFVNNTCVNKRQASGQFLDIASGTSVVNVSNNIFSGIGEVINVTNAQMSNNIIDTSIDDMLFLDEDNYDYRLSADAPAIDGGTDMGMVNGYSLTPEYVYVHPTNSDNRDNNGLVDAGAYELATLSSNTNLSNKQLNVYPNPFQDILTVTNENYKTENIMIVDHLGRDISSSLSSTVDSDKITINTNLIPSGMYILKIGDSQQKLIKL